MRTAGKYTLAISLGLLALSSVAIAKDNENDDSGNVKMQAVVPDPAAGMALETRIKNDGSIMVTGAKITSVGSSTIQASQAWGSYTLAWVINIGPSTKLERRYDGASSLSEFSAGDFISFSGKLDTTQPIGVVTASTVKDFSVQKVNATFSGTVGTLSTTSQSFVLTTKERGNVTVVTSVSTKIAKQGTTTPLTFAAITTGQTMKTSGVWNTLTNTLQADSILILVNTKLLNQRIFEGKVVTLLGSTTLPTTFTYWAGNTTFTVNISPTTQILSKSWNPISLGQLQTADTVRIYGAVRAADMTTLDAYILRDTSVQ